MKRPVILVGYYGMRNFGDDLFVSLISALRPRVDPSAPMWVVAPPLPGARAPRTRFLVPSTLARHWRSHGLHGSLLRLAVNLFAGAAGDTLVMGGGSVLTGVRGARAQQFRLRRLLRLRQWAALGVSVGPVPAEGRQEVDELLGALSTLVVRDERSAADAGRANELGGDLAALVHESPLAPVLAGEREGVIYAPKESWDEVAQEKVVGTIASHAMATGTSVTVLALNCHEQDGDVAACVAAARLFERAGVLPRQTSYEELGLQATVQAIASASFVVTGRLHGGIVSFVTGTPFVLLSDTLKMDDFLDDIGAPSRLRGGLDASGADAVEELLRGPEQIPSDQYISRALAVYLGRT